MKASAPAVGHRRAFAHQCVEHDDVNSCASARRSSAPGSQDLIAAYLDAKFSTRRIRRRFAKLADMDAAAKFKEISRRNMKRIVDAALPSRDGGRDHAAMPRPRRHQESKIRIANRSGVPPTA